MICGIIKVRNEPMGGRESFVSNSSEKFNGGDDGVQLGKNKNSDGKLEKARFSAKIKR